MKYFKHQYLRLSHFSLNFLLLAVFIQIFIIGNQQHIYVAEFQNLKQELETQSKTIKSITNQLQQLKLNYKKLDENLSKELSFKEGLKFVLAFEGGLSDDEGDIGGLTNLGITHAEYDAYRDHKRLPRRSVAYITLEEATNIYKHDYWLSSRCAYMPRRIAISCFDWQVNSGRGVTTLQRVLGGVAVDGIAGHDTFNELNWWLSKPENEDKLLHNYFQARKNLYYRWGVGSQHKFLFGWLRRAQTLKEYLKVP